MAGFVGVAGRAGAEGHAIVARMLAAPALRGRRATKQGAMAIYGQRDVELACDQEGGVLVISGYVREGARGMGARELLIEWRRRGPRLLPDLDGEHAFAVSIDGATHVVRDRYGARPLYAADLPGGGVLFSSAIGPLLAGGVPTDVSRDAVVRSLVLGYVPAPDTALAGVSQVPAGEVWTLSPRRRRARWYAPRERIDARRSLNQAVG